MSNSPLKSKKNPKESVKDSFLDSVIYSILDPILDSVIDLIEMSLAVTLSLQPTAQYDVEIEGGDRMPRDGIRGSNACAKHRIYLVGSDFTLVTDNRAVMLIYGNSNAYYPARIRLFNLRLMDYDFAVVHKPGIDKASGYLSRHPV